MSHPDVRVRIASVIRSENELMRPHRVVVFHLEPSCAGTSTCIHPLAFITRQRYPWQWYPWQRYSMAEGGLAEVDLLEVLWQKWVWQRWVWLW